MKTQTKAKIFGLTGGCIYLLILIVLGVFNSPSQANTNLQTETTSIHINVQMFREAYENAKHVKQTDEEALLSQIEYYPEYCKDWISYRPEGKASFLCHQSKPWTLDIETCHFPDSEICPNHKLPQNN
jgi:hypothetical protein